MDVLGKVEAILNDDLLLISSNEPLARNEIVTVFTTISEPSLLIKGIAFPLYYPKGDIKVICSQDNDMYLAERFKETKTVTKKIIIPSEFARGIAGIARAFQNETKEITEEIPGNWSATFNEKQSLNIQVVREISESDSIGRI